jgi:hypothetical protein
VIKREVLDDFTRWDILLNLGDEKIMSPGSDVPTFLVIEVVVVGVAFNIIVGGLICPINSNLYVVIVESDQG